MPLLLGFVNLDFNVSNASEDALRNNLLVVCNVTFPNFSRNSTSSNSPVVSCKSPPPPSLSVSLSESERNDSCELLRELNPEKVNFLFLLLLLLLLLWGVEAPPDDDFGLLLLTALNTSHPSGGLCKFFVMFSVISFTFGMTFFSIIALKSCDDENGELLPLKL